MNRLFVSMVLTLALAGCGGSHPQDHDHADAHAHGEAEVETGAHGGRLLEQGDLALELKLVEAGGEARFQAWLQRDGKPLVPADASIEVQLLRLGGTVETHALAAQADGSLRAATTVAEPHSFDVEVRARVDGESLRWTYANPEQRTTIAPAVAAESGIVVAAVGPGTIADEHQVQGLLAPIDARVAHAVARFPGVIRSLQVEVGDSVRAGQALASIESNQSLSRYAVSAPIDGVVTERNATLGSLASEGATLYEIADLSRLWVDLHIFGADAQHITAGVAVEITRIGDGRTLRAVIERVLPGMATASQSTIARASIDNDDGLWRPGAAVKARITVAEQPAARVLSLTAVQTLGGVEVAFVRVGDVYEARPVELGMRDATHVEVLGGLAVGDEVVVEQSYLIKADIEKSGAAHEH